MKTYTKTLVPALALSFGIFTNCYAEYEEKIVANDAAAEDRFGQSVSIDGNYAIVSSTNGGGVSNTGSAYIYVSSGGTWTQQTKLTTGVASDGFGNAVSIDGDYAIVGAYNDDDFGLNTGAAYIFVRSGSSWTQQAKITASDPAAADWFGSSVAIDGEYAIIGSILDDDGGNSSGSAYIFKRSGTSWSQQAKITASDGAPSDQFGREVSISGDYAVVGVYQDDDAGSSSGSAYVFVRSGTSWTQQAKLTANDAAADDRFGISVSISGDYVIAGSEFDDDGGKNSGSAYIFNRSGSSWTQQAKITASDATTFDYFGASVSINGNYVIIGADGEDDVENASGSAYIFKRSGSSWTEQTRIKADDADLTDNFGDAVALGNNYSIVGAFNDDDAGNASGSAYIYSADGGDAPLAIELESFDARQIENTIQLSWTTASETENEGFNVYRKTGNNDFVQIASYKGNSELLGALNSTISNYYTFTDNSELRNNELYTYYISDVETNGVETKHDKSAETVRFVLNEEIAQTKLDYVLAQNFPNPFNPSTQINFQIAKTQDVSLKIYNLKGELVKELVNEKMNEGSHSAQWDGTDSFGNQVSSGTYFYKLSAGIFSQTNKMVLLK